MNQTNPKIHKSLLSLAFSGWGLSWKGLIDNRSGEWWLIGQLAVIAAHLIKPWPSSETLAPTTTTLLTFSGILLFILGVLLALRAFWELGASLSPLPDPKPGASLIRIGAYKYCRHPLYQALLISSFGSILFLNSLLHIFLLITLVFLLRGKAQREEKKLQAIHPEYKDYLIKTPAIFPRLPLLDWRS